MYKEVNGIKIINVTPHPINFAVGDEVEIVPPSGVVINARPVEIKVGKHRSGAELVCTHFEANYENSVKLDALEETYPDAVIVGSIIAAQAFPVRVFAMIPAPGFERVPPDQKRMRPDKFTVF